MNTCMKREPVGEGLFPWPRFEENYRLRVMWLYAYLTCLDRCLRQGLQNHHRSANNQGKKDKRTTKGEMQDSFGPGSSRC